MAASLTTTLRIPTTAAAVVVVPRRRSQLTVVRASASEHQEVSANINDGSTGRRGAVVTMVAAAAATVATVAVSRSARAIPCSSEPILGGWENIKNVSAKNIQDLGDWAVKEHDKITGDGVKFRVVTGGCRQVVNGTNYNLEIESKDGQIYAAAMFVSRDDKRQLNDFVGPLDG